MRYTKYLLLVDEYLDCLQYFAAGVNFSGILYMMNIFIPFLT